MEDKNSVLEGFELFDNSSMTRVVDKISLTKSYQFNFPAAFYTKNRIKGMQGVLLYFNKTDSKIAVRFIKELDDKSFRLSLSNGGKYGAYIAAKSFFTLNNIKMPEHAGRYDYKEINNGDIKLFVIDLGSREGGTM